MKKPKNSLILLTIGTVAIVGTLFKMMPYQMVMESLKKNNKQLKPLPGRTFSQLPKTGGDSSRPIIYRQSWKKPEDNPAYFTPRKTRVTPLDFNFLITSDVCKDGHIDLVIIMLSMASHRQYRDAIRDTWGGMNSKNTWAGVPLTMKVKLVFVLGFTNKTDTKSLILEAKEKNDLILMDVKEDYFNLTYKVLMGFKWVKENCKSVKFIMKNDEDSIVHIPWLLERLHSSSWNSTIVGPYFSNEHRRNKGKYGVDTKSYPFEIYPPHVKGNVYIMPITVAYNILEVSEYMPYVNMEDVHITGILARCVGASHSRIPSKEYWPYERPRVCDIALKRKFAGRDLSPLYMRKVWGKIMHPGSCR